MGEEFTVVRKKKSIGRYLFLGLLAFCLLGVGGCTSYKWLGTGTYVGTIQRAYEKADVYRVEFVTLDGNTQVFENAESTFPTWKSNTAGLQAALKRAEQDSSEVEVTTWGWRNSFTSSFPNVMGLEVKQSDRTKKVKSEIKAVLEDLLREKLTIDQAIEKIEKTTR